MQSLREVWNAMSFAGKFVTIAAGVILLCGLIASGL